MVKTWNSGFIQAYDYSEIIITFDVVVYS
jgi:hypothetical protein